MSEQSSRRRRAVRAGVYVLVLLTVLGMVLATATTALATTPAGGTMPPRAPAGSAHGPLTAGTAAEVGTASGREADGAAPGTSSPAPVVVLATTGLTWAALVEEHSAADGQVTDEQRAATQLLGLALTGEPANLVQRTASPVTCPADAWLTLSAGARTRAVAPTSGSPAAPAGECSWPADWDSAVEASRASAYGAVPGALADALAAAGLDAVAIGQGAELALTTSDGRAPASAPSLGQAAESGLPDLTLVDVDGAQDLLDALGVATGLEGVRVVVASLADPEDPGLQLLLLPDGTSGWGDDVPPANGTPELVASPSTHRDGLVQLTDLAPTVLAALGAEVPTSMTGRALTLPREPAALVVEDLSARQLPTTVSRLVDDALHAEASERTTAPVALLLVGAVLALVVGAAAALRGPAGRRRLHGTAVAALCVASLPLGAWLSATVPWWRAGASTSYEPGWAVVPAALVATVVTGLCVTGLLHLLTLAVTSVYDLRLLAARRRRARHGEDAGAAGDDVARPRRAPAPLALTSVLLAALTATVVLADGASGAPLGFNGALGMNAVVAGRFYGLSNTAFALAAAALVLTLGSVVGPLAQAQPTVARRRWVAALGTGVPGALALGAVGLPSAGADVGGALTLVVVLVALAVGLAGGRLTLRRWLGTGFTAVALVGVFALIDHATGSDTHLGRFAGQLQEGTAATTIRRKAWAVVEPFTSSTAALAALVVGVTLIAGAWWWLARERRAWRAGLSGYAALVAPARTAEAWAEAGSESSPEGSAESSTEGSAAQPDDAPDASRPWVGPVLDLEGLVPAWFVPVLRALLVLAVVEVLVNDSGASMAVMSAACAAPLLLALACGRLQARAY